MFQPNFVRTGRPILGYINFDPAQINVGHDYMLKALGIVIHETTHVLGYTPGFFSQNFRNDNGSFYNPVLVSTGI